MHTVLRDSQGALVETMLAGVPVITLNHLTPGMLVDEHCGKIIPIDSQTTPEELIDQIAAAMSDCYHHRDQLAPMGAAAQARAELYTPAAKGVLYRSLHERVLRQRRTMQATPASPAEVPAMNPLIEK